MRAGCGPGARLSTRRSASLGEFAASFPFPLDPFQQRACAALDAGHSVLVAAPTGAGKTVVGEYATHLALATGRKCFYTTPIKALSNQKYSDLAARHGPARVGLLTGDTSLNSEAPVVVMTTEVLRNMIYAGSDTLRGLGYVVLDEVHYLADRFRGAVWEEVIIHLSTSVQLVALSATVSNAEEFADWLVTVRGDTAVVVDEHRPVPLWQSMLVGRRRLDLFADDAQTEIHPDLVRLVREEERRAESADPRRRHRYWRPPSRPDVIERLDAEGLLPAITFIFSRVGCDAAVSQCLRAGLRLVGADERTTIRRIVEERTADLSAEDLPVLGYGEWLDGLERGIAAHHAGLLPTFKQVVEELFAAGLVRAVFATETLSLGINMPARSVVLERLTKWNGEAHAEITPGEYTQLTGRAGRRGIDVEGHAVVLWSPGVDPRQVAGLASTRTYPLRSSFRPSYNMAVNLVGTVGRARARELLESSFAQFQADRAVVGLARQLAANSDALRRLGEAVHCELGDAPGYAELRHRIGELERRSARAGASARPAAAEATLERLRVGDVIRMSSGRRAGLAVVVETGPPTVLTLDRRVRRLSVVDVTDALEPLGRLRFPRGFNLRSPASRRDLASSLRSAGFAEPHRARRSAAEDDPEVDRLRAGLRAHPVHRCPGREDHVRAAERHRRLRTDTDRLAARVESRTNTIARTFDRVCALLDELGYLSGDSVTPAGRMLARIYAECDLLVAECLRRGLWDSLGAAELAAVASTLVYEARRDDAPPPRLPGGPVRDTLAVMARVHVELAEAEASHQLAFLREPDAGFAWPAYRWASGSSLDEVLGDAALAAGDFVRWTKQTIDLVDQVRDAAPEGPVSATARQGVDALRRGVVAYSSVG